MRFFRRALPHITLVLGLMTLTFFCIDRVNAGMAFMTSELSKWVFAVLALFAVITSILLIGCDLRAEARAARRQKRPRQRAENTYLNTDIDEMFLQDMQE